jgi:uncharacterized protein
MKIVIAGGRGLLGQALAARLVSEGHRVLTLTRSRRPDARPWQETLSEHWWSPDGTVGEWAAVLNDADAVVNLAGESIAEGRWTTARKKAILESRLFATRSLVAGIDAARRPPAVLVSSSAQGYYGDRGDVELPEAAGPGQGFLPDVCVAWEGEARKAERRTRVVLLRTGIVLAAQAGALPKMALPFRLFAGGPMGSGRQFMSWIHLDDWVGIATQGILDARVAGARNLGAPRPVRNREFAATLGRVLGKPSVVPAPAFALRLAVGEMATPLLLASTRMVPAAVLADGYRFRFEEAADALRNLLT